MSGYYGGRLDALIMRVMDVLLAFPGILLALAIVSVLTPGLTNVMIAVGLSAVPTYARLVRASVLSARENLYVEAARALGGRDLGILARYILPNVVAPLIVTATLGLGTAILSAAALSFLGLGQPAAAAGVGPHAQRGPRLPARGLVDLDLPRPRHHADGARHEPARRRPARRPRPAPPGMRPLGIREVW